MISTLKERLKEKERRKFFVVFLGGKMIGVGIALLAVKYLIGSVALAGGSAGHDRGSASDRHHQRDEHRMGAGDGVPGVLHAGGLHDVGGRFRTHPRGREHPPRVHRRHRPLRHLVLRDRLRVHVREWQRLDRPRVLLPERRAGDVRNDRRCLHGVLPVPVRVRRHVLDDHVGRDGGPHRLQGRPALQLRGVGLHLPDHRPLDLGPGRLARHDGHAVP